MNVLYLLSDDMRADIGAYFGTNQSIVHTPNLDALVSDSLLFEHAFCQISVCSPSRQSFLTGLRPDTHRVWNFLDHNPKDTQATPGHFKDNGYLTYGLGKTFHEDNGRWNENRYWTLHAPGLPYFPYEANECPKGGEGGGQCILDDDEIYDYQLRLATMNTLRHAAKYSALQKKPFFLMAGFRDPHAPWAAPQRMYDLYDATKINLPPPQAKTLGKDTPLIAWSRGLNICLANGTSFPYSYNQPVPDWVLRNQRKAYYAAVSYVDEHVGAILQVLASLGLANDTIVVFHSDHGYILGEHGYWEKKSNFDLAVRVPLMIKVPGVTDQPNYNGRTHELLDLVDVFPTLSALSGLGAPKGVDGLDLSAIILNNDSGTSIPQNSTSSPRREAAYAQFPACGMSSIHAVRKECNNVPAAKFDFMGYSIRTLRWRYTAWYPWDGINLVAHWDGDFVQELYNHELDDSSNLGRWENDNLATKFPNVARRLRRKLEAFFRQRDMDKNKWEPPAFGATTFSSDSH